MTDLTLSATTLAAFVVGALWRRLYGGWLSFDRASLLTIAVIVFSIPAWWVWDTPDTCWRPILIQIAIALQFCLGVQFDDFYLCAVRYTLGPTLLVVACEDYHLPEPYLLLPFVVGPLIALVYYLGGRSTADGHPWVITWPWDTPTEQMTNGYTAFGELAAGGLSALAFVITPLMRMT